MAARKRVASLPGILTNRHGGNPLAISLSTRALTLAISLTCLAVEIGLQVNQSPDLRDAATWASLLGPLLAAGALLAAEWAWFDGQKVRACLILCAGLLFSGFALANSFHRTSLVLDTPLAAATSADADRKRIEDERKSAADDVSQAKANMAQEITNGGCGPICKGFQAQQTAAEEKVMQLDAKLDSLPAPNFQANDAWRIEKMTAGLVTAEQVIIAKPLLLPIGLNLGAIFAIGIAFAPNGGTGRRRSEQPSRPVLVVSNDAKPVSDPVVSILRGAGRPLTNDELADRMGVVKGTAHKKVDALIDAGLVRRERDGRQVRISVA